MKKYILTAIMLSLLFIQAALYGVNDLLVLGLIILTAGFIFVSLIKLHAGNRKMMRVAAKKDSTLYKFLSSDRTFLLVVIAIFSSLLFSTVLVVLVKGLVLQHGYLPFLVTMFLSSLLIYSFLNTDVHSSTFDENAQEDIASHGNQLARILDAAIALNLILSLAFSAYDTFEFKTSDVSFENFTDKAVEQSIVGTDYNQYSRLFINAYLLMDYVKIALTKMFVELFNLQNNFYGFYIVIFFLNMLKLFAFSFSFVVLQRGFDGTANLLMPIVKKWGGRLEVFIISNSTRLYELVKTKTKTKTDSLIE